MIQPVAWLVAGLVLCGLEMVVPGVFLLWMGLAALGAGLLALTGMALHWQVLAFAVLACGLIALVAMRLRRHKGIDRVNAPAGNLVGQTCRALDFADGEGRVALGDGQWLARLSGPGEVAPGQALRVVGLDGTVLLVTTA